ncbi:hypothetical protein P4O66_006303 [Electrophorus voltai]|uniref:Uncharacterized protein n=1 Tax=Electrophorus voltai TaxID=2609070 RepID=A0AAD8ZLQ3_9TELE|nr:hypothetical protein P4O66_006303 [Electrophorus voltai]
MLLQWSTSPFTLMKLASTLPKTRSRARIIRHHAIVSVPGQCSSNSTKYGAISQNGVVRHHATLAFYHTAHIITFLNTLHNVLIPYNQGDGPEQSRFVVIWNNVSTRLLRRWRKLEVTLMREHARQYFPHCLTRGNITCYVDEIYGQTEIGDKMHSSFLCQS